MDHKQVANRIYDALVILNEDFYTLPKVGNSADNFVSKVMHTIKSTSMSRNREKAWMFA